MQPFNHHFFVFNHHFFVVNHHYWIILIYLNQLYQQYNPRNSRLNHAETLIVPYKNRQFPGPEITTLSPRPWGRRVPPRTDATFQWWPAACGESLPKSHLQRSSHRAAGPWHFPKPHMVALWMKDVSDFKKTLVSYEDHNFNGYSYFFIWRSGGFIQFNYFLAVNIVHIATLDDWWLTFWFHIVSVEVFQTKNDRQGFPSNVVFFDISYSSFLAWMIGGSSLDVGDLLGHPWVSSTKKSWQHVWSNDALSMIYSSWFKRKQFWRITDLLRCTPMKLCCVDSSKATSVCGRRAIQKNLHWRSDNASPGWIHP